MARGESRPSVNVSEQQILKTFHRVTHETLKSSINQNSLNGNTERVSPQQVNLILMKKLNLIFKKKHQIAEQAASGKSDGCDQPAKTGGSCGSLRCGAMMAAPPSRR